VAEVTNWLAGLNPVWQGLTGGIVITLMNLAGALAILIWRKPTPKMLDTALGFAAGVMLTASFTSLILPGVSYGGIWPVMVGVALGALALDLTDRVTPHLHSVVGREGPPNARLRGVWLFIIAISIHNAPEGLAVGVGFGSSNFSDALTLMLAIGIQNIPEGLAVAIAARNAGMGANFYSSLVGLRAGLIEIPMAVLGAVAVHFFSALLPYAMGFAAGAMLFVISDEIVPETHRSGHQRLATFGTLLGVVVMLYLDVSLG
jgi:ZIP family zinc transporter